MYIIKVQAAFDASHFLEKTKTKCDCLHGHRWTVWLQLSSQTLSSEGWVINFSLAKKWLEEIIHQYDHNLLNLFLKQPTAENLCFVIFHHVHKKLVVYNKKEKRKIQIIDIEIAETPGNTSKYTYQPNDNVRSEALQAAWRIKPEEEKQEKSKKNSEASKKGWQKPDERERRMKGLLEANQNPVLRKNRSDRMKENNPMQNPKAIEKMLLSLKKSIKNRPNKEEKQIIQLFKDNKIPLRYVGDGSVIIDGKNPDFINEQCKIIVEYNNEFWHSDDNPWYDVSDDSEKRKKFFEERGYKIYFIWAQAFKKDKTSIIKEIKELF